MKCPALTHSISNMKNFGEIQTGAPGQRGTSDKPEEEEIIWTAKINNLSLMYFT